VYGTPPPRKCDELTPTHPTTAYGRAKLKAEQVARFEHSQPLVLRCAVVYGPGDRGNVRRLINSVAERRAFVVGDGENRKSLLYAENLADRVIACFEKGLHGTWCVSDAPSPTQLGLMKEVASALNRPAPLFIPASVALGGAFLLDVLERLRTGCRGSWSRTVRTLAAETRVDGTLLDSVIGYQPRISLAEGIAQSVL
jgi:UDP-glucose 4-epimerase